MADYAGIYDRVHAENEGYQLPHHSPGLLLVRQNEARLRAEGPRHIDLGCGAGFVVEQMREWGFDSVGADISAQAVETANARMGEGAAAVIENGRAPFPDHSFDLVTCFDVLEHLDREDVPGLRDEFLRLLKPGGLLFCNISLRLAGSVDHEGVNLHRTVEPPQWWDAIFAFDEYTVLRAKQDMSCWKRA
ncbi:class I SAM-dependent methyltransferase [Brevundimonas sp. 2R-24]|uniref:Class I SAM-dependent methyltransferase n=1 Tax=Peiella sedimenti TaxID=3061083 RepID=A0ABT8SJX7_9CAUL|nr:class I SAM-dependent methyltransferase [Caulobacteraceae bacterium XZ-24]